jgi:2-methylcitrate dehydratase PrpD
MIRRVTFTVDPESEKAGLNKMTSLLAVTMKGGQVITGRAEFAKGHPANPMSYDEEAEKVFGCAEYAKWPKAKCESLVRLVRTLDTAPNVAAIVGAVTM